MNALSTPIADVPGVGRPAVRALAAQDLHLVGDLAGRDWPGDVLRELVRHAWEHGPDSPAP